jgi:hypothetical protein
MSDLSDGGQRLLAFLDGLPVEARWLAGHRIVWQTGQQDGPDGVGPEDHTHCSAFVAAVALDLDIYVLRPPHHTQELLANAQVEWLGGATFPGPAAAASGWSSLGKASDAGALAAAVSAANSGKLVIAGYRQPDVDGVETPGHAAIVRPQTTAPSAENGPQVTMAGTRNWREITMRAAFASHPQAWPGGIALFVHATDLEQQFSAEAGIG